MLLFAHRCCNGGMCPYIGIASSAGTQLVSFQYPKPDLSSASVLQVDMEERFCSKVKELGCTCITISHRPALVAFHDLVLALDGEGGWSIHEGVTGSFTEETIPEDGVVGNGAMQRSGGQGTADKARTKDAAAVLQGMKVGRVPCSLC